MTSDRSGALRSGDILDESLARLAATGPEWGTACPTTARWRPRPWSGSAIRTPPAAGPGRHRDIALAAAACRPGAGFGMGKGIISACRCRLMPTAW